MKELQLSFYNKTNSFLPGNLNVYLLIYLDDQYHKYALSKKGEIERL